LGSLSNIAKLLNLYCYSGKKFRYFIFDIAVSLRYIEEKSACTAIY